MRNYLKTWSFRWLVAAFAAFNLSAAQAQTTQVYAFDDARYRNGLDLLERQQYAAAQHEFREFLAQQTQDEKAIQAEYYAGLCAMYLGQPDFDYLLETFVAKYPTHLMALNAYQNIGDYYFKQGDYQNALPYLKQIYRPRSQSSKDLEISYKYGYSLYQLKRYDQALNVFEGLQTGSHDYAAPATYYAGYIHYLQKNYAAAAENLLQIKDHPKYKNDVDVLLPTVYYRLKRYDDVIAYAEQLLGKGRPTPDALSLVIADSYYQKGNYAQAVNYFERFEKNNKPLERTVAYRLAFAHSKQKNNAKAVTYFGQAADGADSLAQIAAYHMALSYIEMGQKQAAIGPLDKCRDLNFDRNLKELAAFNYAKVNYDISDFKECIAGCRFYDKTFPNGQFTEDLNVLESEAYLNGNDYLAAIRYIEGLGNRSRRVQTGYQRVTYNYGAELFNDGKFPQAVAMLKKSLTAPVAKETVNAAHYWLGEAYSQGEKYDSALVYYQRVEPGSKEHLPTQYAMGYAYYNTKAYPQALALFANYVQGSPTGRNRVDAFTRLADCQFVQSDFALALENYNRALDQGGADAEYIYYQRGLAQSFLKQPDASNASFDLLIGRFPNSRFTDLAFYQKADNFFSNQRPELAAREYTNLLTKLPNSELVPYALVRRGLSYNLNGDEAGAIRDYKAVIDRFAAHPAAGNAIQSLQELAGRGVAVADLEGYRQKYRQANPNSKATLVGDLNEAKAPYDNGNYALAVTSLNNFIRQAPESNERHDAYYFLGMAYEQLGDAANAVASFDKAKGTYQSRATLRAADLDYQRGNYQAAVDRYLPILTDATDNRRQANAIEGLMQSYFKLGDLNQAEFYAGEANKRGLTRIKGKADLYLAKVMLERGQTDNALAALRAVAKNNPDVNGAEAQYLVGDALRRKKDFNGSITELIKVRTQFSQYDKWLYEAFLLIADNYVSLDNTFQAKATLNSIVENSKDPAVVERAKQKLAQL
jgi:tetratricopeptide (TPR) repeat protein